MTPPTHWQRLRHKLYTSSTVVVCGYVPIGVSYFLDILPDMLTILGDPELSGIIAAKIGPMLPFYMRLLGALTIVCRLRKQIFCILRKGNT